MAHSTSHRQINNPFTHYEAVISLN